VAEERLKLAVFIDFDNIQIGVKDTLGKEFEVSLVLEALKERGEVVSKIAYGDWHRAGDQSLQMTQHAVQLVQRNVTPRGDKNGADINLALDALEMAFTRHHINAFAIVGGDSDFITLVEKLKQYDKRVFVVGGRAFTSNILQKNCHEFLAYENLLRSGGDADGSRSGRSVRGQRRTGGEARPLTAAWPNVQRALKVLAEREVAPQIGLLKSTILQLDPTFSERDYGVGSFLEFMQRMDRARIVHLRKNDQGYLVESLEQEGAGTPQGPEETGGSEAPAEAAGSAAPQGEPFASVSSAAPASGVASPQALEMLRQALTAAGAKTPNRPLYLRQVRQALKTVDKDSVEGNYGPRTVLDLVHQAQREGWVRLHRDRKGVLRIFHVVSAPSVPPAVIEPAAGGETSAPTDLPQAAETALSSEAVVGTEGGPALEGASLEVDQPVADEAAAAETPAERKVRKPRSAGVEGKTVRRRAPTRRKPKESTQE
jgi:uncharacterized LabA/DUF88 family protein